MEEFRQKLIETQNQVNSFRDALKRLDGMTVHTYHYHHQITVTGGGGGGGGGEKKTTWGAPWPMPEGQRGIWNVPGNMPVFLHRGEMVLPRPVAEWFRRTGPVTQNVNVTVNVSGGGVDAGKIAEIVSREIARRLRAM